MENIGKHVNKQLENILICKEDVSPYVESALQRTLKCFAPNKNKYYFDKKVLLFHSGQYSIFLYYLANTIYRMTGDPKLSEKVYYLNKILHSNDWFYEIEMPEYWGVEHPISSVLGRAKYSNGLFIYQGCTVGGNRGKYPSLGKNVIMYANSKILGDSHIGNNVMISSDTIIKDQDVPDNCLVFGCSPNLKIIVKNEEYMANKLLHFWDQM